MKKAPEVSVEITAECRVYASENSSKVIQAMKNVLDNCSPELVDSRLKVVSRNPQALGTIYEQVRSRAILGVFRRVLEFNTNANSTWFYLNKQAAYAGIVSICWDEAESPLGPIKITITSNQLTHMINWLVS